ncbi:MAG: hypothetical protein ACI84C_000530 [Flavobacteriales bacterium]|jgi:hypothetical protein
MKNGLGLSNEFSVLSLLLSASCSLSSARTSQRFPLYNSQCLNNKGPCRGPIFVPSPTRQKHSEEQQKERKTEKQFVAENS